MDTDKFVLPLRIGEAVLGLLTMALVANWIHWADGSTSGDVSFLLFCGIWGFLVAIILLAVKMVAKPPSNEVLIGVAVADVVSAIFNFAGFIAVAADIGDFKCSSVGNIVFDNGGFTHACRGLKSAIAMAAFAWVLWTISAVISVMPAANAAKGMGGGGGGGGSAPADPPQNA